VPELAQLQFLNTDAKPLAILSEAEADSMLAHIARRIAEISGSIRERAAGNKKKRHKPAIRSAVAGKNGVGFFISHSHVDGDFAELLKLKLEKAGYTAWIDIDRLKPGMGWQEAIDTAIQGAAAVIAVMSPDGRSSEYVTYEWAFAWGRRIKIIPIMLRQTSLHPKLATLQYLDFTNRASRHWVELFDALEDLVSADETLSEPELEAEA
jgi:hypothetical protein